MSLKISKDTEGGVLLYQLCDILEKTKQRDRKQMSGGPGLRVG